MRQALGLWLCFLVFLFCGIVRADSLPPGDPGMQVDDPLCQSTVPCATLVGGPNGTTPFTFFSDANGNGPTPPGNMFQTQTAFSSLDIEAFVNFTDPNLITCTSHTRGSDGQIIGTPFDCRVTIFTNVAGAPAGTPDVADMYLNENCGEFTCPGFPANDVFTITLTGWAANLEFTATPNGPAPLAPLITSPEPSSLAMFSTCIAALVGRRCWKTVRSYRMRSRPLSG